MTIVENLGFCLLLLLVVVLVFHSHRNHQTQFGHARQKYHQTQFGHARQKYHQTLTVWPCQTKVPSNTHSLAMPDKSTIKHSQFGHARQKYHQTLTVWPCQTKVPSNTHSLAMPDKQTYAIHIISDDGNCLMGAILWWS